MARKSLTAAAAHTEAAPIVPAKRLVNPESRIYATFLLDKSGSMEESGALRAAVAALPGFRESVLKHDRLSRRLEWAFLTFSDEVTVERDFGQVAEWNPPAELRGGSGTAMGTAILEALRLQRAHISRHAERGIGLHHAFMILVTDGFPTGEEPEMFDEAAEEIRRAEKDRFAFFPIGVEGADFAKLAELTSKRQPLQLATIGHFSALMSWVLESITAASNSYVGEAVSLTNPMAASDSGMGWAVIPAMPGKPVTDD